VHVVWRLVGVADEPSIRQATAGEGMQANEAKGLLIESLFVLASH
jgi:hypothetical protein